MSVDGLNLHYRSTFSFDILNNSVLSQAKADNRFTLSFRVKAQSYAMGNIADT